MLLFPALCHLHRRLIALGMRVVMPLGPLEKFILLNRHKTDQVWAKGACLELVLRWLEGESLKEVWCWYLFYEHEKLFK